MFLEVVVGLQMAEVFLEVLSAQHIHHRYGDIFSEDLDYQDTTVCNWDI